MSKYGCVLSNSGTSGNTSVGWREPRNFRHLCKKMKVKTESPIGPTMPWQSITHGTEPVFLVCLTLMLDKTEFDF